MKRRLTKIWRKLGPGLITGASDDDPSGIATYSQAGAGFGLSLLWTALLTYPLMFAIQEMCARIAIVTSTDLTEVIKKHYSPFLLYGTILTITPAIIFNIAANIAGMGAVAHLLVPSISSFSCSVMIIGLLIICLSFSNYNKMASMMKWLCVVLLVYIIVPFLVQTNWTETFYAAIIPQIQWNKEFMAMLVAILGTTISPYLFFWQTSISLENQNHQTRSKHESQILAMRLDINAGMFLSNLVMFFIILTTSSVLFRAGIHQVETVEMAAQALRPLAGDLAYVLFAMGIIGTGLLAIPVLAGALSYIIAEASNWKKGMDNKPWEAKEFYTVMFLSMVIGLLLNGLAIDPMKSLIYTSIAYGIIAPFLTGIILHICNNKKIMGRFTNTLFQNILGFILLILMSLSAFTLIFLHFSPI